MLPETFTCDHYRAPYGLVFVGIRCPTRDEQCHFARAKWPKCIETFEIELETRNGRRLMLDTIVTSIAKWVFEVDERDDEEIMDMTSMALLSDLDTDSSVLSYFDSYNGSEED
jgi:hypothetical protein